MDNQYLSYEQLIKFCKSYKLKMAPELYKGPWDDSLLKQYTVGDSLLEQLVLVLLPPPFRLAYVLFLLYQHPSP